MTPPASTALPAAPLDRVAPPAAPPGLAPALPGAGAGPPPSDEAAPPLPPLHDALALARLIPRGDQWRLFSELAAEARYVDIETTGLDPSDEITLVGVSDGHGTRVLVRGRDLSTAALADALAHARLLVTYNGGAFDLPRLRRAFPGLPGWDLPHFDLATAARRLGLKGGLKGVEQALGVRRPRDLRGVDGLAAVSLWRAHQAGDPDALRRLVRYCRADVDGLVCLAPRLYARLAQRREPPAGQPPLLLLGTDRAPTG